MFPSYRNQLIDFWRKSMDWFQYGGNIGSYYVKFVIILYKGSYYVMLCSK